ncbi:hypothetical protein DFAR_3290026 [Desulfarculales bacterium]
MECGDRERLLRDKCAQRWQSPFFSCTRLSRTTILGWVRLYRQGGGKWESLYPMGRNDRGGSRALDEDTAQALARLRREMPTAVSDYPHQRDDAPTLNLARRDPQGAHRLPLPAPAGADGQTGHPTCRPQTLRGRAAQRHLAEGRHAWADAPGGRQTA